MTGMDSVAEVIKAPAGLRVALQQPQNRFCEISQLLLSCSSVGAFPGQLMAIGSNYLCVDLHHTECQFLLFFEKYWHSVWHSFTIQNASAFLFLQPAVEEHRECNTVQYSTVGYNAAQQDTTNHSTVQDSCRRQTSHRRGEPNCCSACFLGTLMAHCSW
jgi:hypothetical protein